MLPPVEPTLPFPGLEVPWWIEPRGPDPEDSFTPFTEEAEEGVAPQTGEEA